MAIHRGLLSSLRWRTRITLWTAAVLAGLVVVSFAKLAELALHAFTLLAQGRPWVTFILTPAIGMTAVWCTRRYFSGIQGSGIPQVIAATKLVSQGGEISKLVSIRIAIGKIVVGAFALLGGFSAGREGPSVQVAASIMHASHRLLPHSRALRPADLILAGGAAGVAAAFNTPLAGIVFAIEELGRRLETRTSGVLISTIILSGLVSIALLGNYNYFGQFSVLPQSASIIMPVLAGGVLCGLLGGAFSWLMLWPQKAKDFPLWVWRRNHPVRFAGICGLLVAVIGWAGDGLSFGTGYEVTKQAASGALELPWHASITRFLATIVSYYSGIPGGIFAPSLAVGGALGATLSPLLPDAGGTAPFMALCMAGFLAAVTQSPITAAIIVMEMIDGHEMVIGLMAVSFIANVVSSRLSPELYQHLALDWMPAHREWHASAPDKPD
ncbi:H+/Cl- antiporter ClcA [Paucimonas lemoignei]|uniref:H+/Cl-antiporter ClcA n=1 Tax=Paucimonas lemoignei TaxID=29443 RepID=A0A4R3HSQ8_PAULE|nr:chloride channel protein [Paucimonas lemoignei]TCS35171.1 H+/Cl- antiporter ClcA [Paucimonas lemoignei]